MVRTHRSKSAQAGTPTLPLTNCVTMDESLTLPTLHLSKEKVTVLRSVTARITGVHEMLTTVTAKNQHHVMLIKVKKFRLHLKKKSF